VITRRAATVRGAERRHGGGPKLTKIAKITENPVRLVTFAIVAARREPPVV
jgi:hypothetical protein